MTTAQELKTRFAPAEAALRNMQNMLDAEQRATLPELNKDELYILATECGAEMGPDHCWKCEAWDMWLDMEDE